VNWHHAIWMFPGLILGLTFHECAHAWSASLLGDDFARRQGRVSLNPLRHLSPLGTLAILLLPFGWGRPVPVNLYNFKHPRRDFLLTSLAGPAANLVVAAACLALMQWTRHSYQFGPRGVQPMSYAGHLLAMAVLINILLATLNMVPIPPLDGSRIWPCVIPGLKPIGSRRMNSVWLVVLIVVLGSHSLRPLLDSVVQQAIRLLPTSDAKLVETHCLDASTACEAKQWGKAQRQATAALAIDSRCAVAYCLRAEARAWQADWHAALDDINQAIALNTAPALAPVLYRCRAQILRGLGRPDEAETDAAVPQPPTSPRPKGPR